MTRIIPLALYVLFFNSHQVLALPNVDNFDDGRFLNAIVGKILRLGSTEFSKDSNNEQGYLKSIPRDVILLILNFLDPKSLVLFSRSCKYHYDLQTIYIKTQNPDYILFGENGWMDKIKPNSKLLLRQETLQTPSTLNKLKPIFDRYPGLNLVVDVSRELKSEILNINFIKHMVITNTNGDITQTPNSFKLEHLENLDISGLVNLKTINPWFMSSCINLQAFYAILPNLEEIQPYAFNGCKNLSRIYTKWPNLKKIERSFMIGCQNIQELDASRWKELETINNHFMSCCSKLYSLKTTNWPQNKVNIGWNFLDLTNMSDESIELIRQNHGFKKSKR